MIKTDKGKRRKLSHEILGLIGISALLALILFLTLSRVASIIAEKYVFNNDVIMSEFDWIALDQKIFFGSALAAVILFTALFLSMLGERLAYIRKLTEGIDALGKGQEDHVISLDPIIKSLVTRTSLLLTALSGTLESPVKHPEEINAFIFA